MIQSGWKKTGFHPFDEKAILKHVEKALGHYEEMESPDCHSAGIVVEVIENHIPKKLQKKKKVPVEENKPYLVSEMREQVEKEEMRKRENKELSRIKAQKREERKKEHLQKVEERKEAIALRKQKRKEESQRKKEHQLQKQEKRQRIAHQHVLAKKKRQDEKERNKCKACGRYWRTSPDWVECDNWSKCGFTLCLSCQKKTPHKMEHHGKNVTGYQCILLYVVDLEMYAQFIK